MGYGHSVNASHFTGKKKSVKTLRKRVVREKQEKHKNKYARFSNVDMWHSVEAEIQKLVQT